MNAPPALSAYVAAARAEHARPAAVAAALRVERDDLRGARAIAPVDARARAREILADPVFRHRRNVGTAPEATLVERFVSWLRDLFERFLRATIGRARVGATASNAIGTVLVLVSVLVVAFVVLRLFLTIGPRTGRAAATLVVEGDDGSLVARADDAAQRADFRSAVTYAFGAALRRLDRLGIVPFDPARTPNEYRRAVRRARLAFDAPFGVLAGAFVLAIYGERPPDAARWTQIRASLDAMRDEQLGR